MNISKGNNINLIEEKIENINKEKGGYVVNLHILENCNYKCKHCFAHFNCKEMLSLATWKRIVDNISSSIHVKRFNIAGGEPLLYPDLEKLIRYIYDKGLKVSIISNGHLMTSKWISDNAKLIDTIGLSVDSLIEDNLIELGRTTYDNKVLSSDKLFKLCDNIKNNNVKLKINTVVTKINHEECFVDLMNSIKVDRWKVLKMKVFKNSNFDNSSLKITNKEFYDFVSNNQCNNLIVEKSLLNSYVMIDASGWLVDNTNDNYLKVSNVDKEDFSKGFKRLSFNKELYFSRY